MQINSYRLNQLISQGLVQSVLPLPKFPKYIVGKTYWCGYWQKYYTVLDSKYEKCGKYEHLISVTIKWEDGKVATLCTSLDNRRVYELILTGIN